MKQSAAELRQEIVDFFRQDLVGPAHGEEEVLEERPSLRYAAGVLFPRSSVNDESAEVNGVGEDPTAMPASQPEDAAPLGEEEGEPVGQDVIEDEHDDTITLANSFKPAAMGVSYCLDGPGTLEITVTAAVYSVVHENDLRRYKRQRLNVPLIHVEVAADQTWRVDDKCLADGLRLRTVVRPRDGSFLCTSTIVNETKEGSSNAQEFFQVEMTIRCADGAPRFREYRRLVAPISDDEERSLAMLYRNRAVFAAGHGCAANWDGVTGGRACIVRTSVIPAVRVPPIVPTDANASFANMQFLSGDGATDQEILDALRELPRQYEGWIAERERDLETLPSVFHERGRAHLGNCRRACTRIRDGIRLLDEDGHALRAFKLMNAAMLRQQYHSRLRRRLQDDWAGLPTSYSSEFRRRGFWRTFQIGFVLMTLAGLVPDAPAAERDIVDLIWFPTGGGKTEAYLGLSAFTLFRRRLADRENTGCAILMRYTLRLLTSQQFQRAASMICACETIRRENPNVLGNTPFSIGLWVGKSLTPNNEAEAIKALNRMHREPDAKNPFQLLGCPWCGTELANRDRFGYIAERGRVIFKCPADDCPFGEPDAPLPVCVVDESIYARPPSLLIGTVDKFAMLAWRAEARPIFGGGTQSPPDLIIQDELHLISGPLGSMVGLYEGAIDLLCRDTSGRGPKIVASTATIRRAAEQCRALFDRGTAQYPPQGLDAGDSFFAREEPDADGRLYVGFLPTAASSPLTAQIRAVAALVQGVPLRGGAAPPAVIDPYWTLVQYFSSLKELGRAATLVTADIPEYLPSMQRRHSIPKELKRRLFRTEEMTSRKNEAEIPKILRDLERPYTGPAAEPGTQPLDTLLATNMISVGVDVDRLGLMMVVTQPKATSEYIQASSRVGRSRDAPGLVVTLYSAARPRDRSHYEHFRAYHDAFYRFVEPTSVTPFAVPALERALHAVLVIIARHVVGLNNVREFDPNDRAYRSAVEFLKRRVESVDDEQLKDFDGWVRRRTEEWRRMQPSKWGGFGPAEEPFLMHPMGAPPPTGEFSHYRKDLDYWEIPTSMRNVDAECDGVVVTYPGGE